MVSMIFDNLAASDSREEFLRSYPSIRNTTQRCNMPPSLRALNFADIRDSRQKTTPV
jgi:hypothetical protein